MATNDSNPSLFHYARWGKFKDVIDRASTHPHEADFKTVGGNTALHWLALTDAPMDAVEAVHRACPGSADITNNWSDTPLDLAIQRNASQKMIDFLRCPDEIDENLPMPFIDISSQVGSHAHMGASGVSTTMSLYSESNLFQEASMRSRMRRSDTLEEQEDECEDLADTIFGTEVSKNTFQQTVDDLCFEVDDVRRNNIELQEMQHATEKKYNDLREIVDRVVVEKITELQTKIKEMELTIHDLKQEKNGRMKKSRNAGIEQYTDL
eukprot:CAMPEP_0194354450 /NCGR_PEP_ID=MMETSP0174-20130528/2614_1 /TAXON_ID=216777 /ORGANISM="Proboscia alata, Strain PI-D3" /LENGTH=265 /DNA_ID=CAMNT_0039123411 /DNA_START=22 /DNA_END=819 /DNA_ORIENTATION=+